MRHRAAPGPRGRRSRGQREGASGPMSPAGPEDHAPQAPALGRPPRSGDGPHRPAPFAALPRNGSAMMGSLPRREVERCWGKVSAEGGRDPLPGLRREARLPAGLLAPRLPLRGRPPFHAGRPRPRRRPGQGRGRAAEARRGDARIPERSGSALPRTRRPSAPGRARVRGGGLAGGWEPRFGLRGRTGGPGPAGRDADEIGLRGKRPHGRRCGS